jgi:hypothetical protein
VGLGWRTMKRLTCDVVEAERPNMLAAKIPRPEAATAIEDGRERGDRLGSAKTVGLRATKGAARIYDVRSVSSSRTGRLECCSHLGREEMGS